MPSSIDACKDPRADPLCFQHLMLTKILELTLDAFHHWCSRKMLCIPYIILCMSPTRKCTLAGCTSQHQRRFLLVDFICVDTSQAAKMTRIGSCDNDFWHPKRFETPAQFHHHTWTRTRKIDLDSMDTDWIRAQNEDESECQYSRVVSCTTPYRTLPRGPAINFPHRTQRHCPSGTKFGWHKHTPGKGSLKTTHVPPCTYLYVCLHVCACVCVCALYMCIAHVYMNTQNVYATDCSKLQA